ncbi:MAG TPA: antitoxin [Tessaracoccus flavescens]|uniref:Antitoxin n=1 Tax=Tessaracoccus flavescens TaxID=399497 RepID=A0A921ES30_9ACTN|nr:antitoxin [Tessaracoccus flavescens]
MTEQPNKFGNADQYVDKAKDYAQENPEHARSWIDKAEDFIDEKTGGKYADKVDAAGDWVEGQLGLPNNTNNPAPDVDATDRVEAPADPAEPVIRPDTTQQ